MKNIKSLLFLICSIAVILTSCSKDDDAASTASSCVTNTTASGSITVGSETMSGVYLSPCYTGFADMAGQEIFPSDVKSGYTAVVVTGDTAISEEMLMYTDTACSTPSMTWKQGRSEFTVGSASGSNYAVTYKDATVKILPSTDAAKSHMETFAAAVNLVATFVVGTETNVTSSGNTKYNLVLVTSTTVKTGDADDNATPSEADSMVMTKSCE